MSKFKIGGSTGDIATEGSTITKGATGRRSAGVVVAIVVALGGIATALIKACG